MCVLLNETFAIFKSSIVKQTGVCWRCFRYCGQAIFHTLMFHQSFERALRKHVSTTVICSIQSKLDNLRTKVSRLFTHFLNIYYIVFSLHCFDTVGWQEWRPTCKKSRFSNPQRFFSIGELKWDLQNNRPVKHLVVVIVVVVVVVHGAAAAVLCSNCVVLEYYFLNFVKN